MHPKHIADLIEKCQAAGVDSFSWTDRDGGNVTLKFRGARVEVTTIPAPEPVKETEAPMPAPGLEMPNPGPERLAGSPDPEVETDWCACGHSLFVEHNVAGECMLGCDPGLCSSRPPTAEKPRGA